MTDDKAALASLCRRCLVALFPPVNLSLSLFSEVLYLWPAASQPTPGSLQDEDMNLSCSEANGEEALLFSLPRTGGPHPQGYKTPTPALGPFTGPLFWLGAGRPK